MRKYLQTLKACTLFENISDADIEKLLTCLNSMVKRYHKGSPIIWVGDAIPFVGIVLSGTVQIIKEDYLGNKNILTELSISEIFAETFVCAGIKKSPVTVLSVDECEILFIDYGKITSVCPSTCTFHTKIIANMLRLLANKNLMLNQKIEFISKRTTREKLLSYLAVQSEKGKSKSFAIPFSRHELADFLCVDRSAMSRELCRLRDEGLLEFHGNNFKLL